MSDYQMGARRKKGCKNNIFIINGIIHDVLKSNKMHPVNLQSYDYQQMFDLINLKQVLFDIYDAGVNDDTPELLYQANHGCQDSHGSDRETDTEGYCLTGGHLRLHPRLRSGGHHWSGVC